MATAKEISDTARERAMGAYRDWLSGEYTPDMLRKKYGVGYSRVYQLINKGRRLSTPTRHWSYGILHKAELVELAPMRALLERVAENG